MMTHGVKPARWTFFNEEVMPIASWRAPTTVDCCFSMGGRWGCVHSLNSMPLKQGNLCGRFAISVKKPKPLTKPSKAFSSVIDEPPLVQLNPTLCQAESMFWWVNPRATENIHIYQPCTNHLPTNRQPCGHKFPIWFSFSLRGAGNWRRSDWSNMIIPAV